MAIDIAPGTWVKVTVKKAPRAAAATKTLEKLFRKDPGVKKEITRRKASRPVTEHQRGGRMWKDRPVHLKSVATQPGASYRIFGSVDVLRELGSVEQYIEVAAQ